MRAKLVAGNWKMHGSLPDNAKLLTELLAASTGLSQAQQAVCVPFPYLEQVRSILRGSRIAWGAQNLSQHSKGAYTGEVAGTMLREFECTYAIVGHSERRALYNEDSDTVAFKFEAALDSGLVPILCVGETLAQREAGDTESVVDAQLAAVTKRFGVQSLASAVIAYEPVWAIGTGRTATPDQAQAVHAHIREGVASEHPGVAEAVRILYGGSVKASNAAELLAMPDIDGGLIGGASLIDGDFMAICRAADR